MRPYEKRQTACVARDDLGARCSAEGTRQARSLNKETQQMQILHHERQRAGEIPFF